ncbi:MAG: hypothetical protein ACOYMA_17040, partial [Bacteroidia bacterium]
KGIAFDFILELFYQGVFFSAICTNNFKNVPNLIPLLRGVPITIGSRPGWRIYNFKLHHNFQ